MRGRSIALFILFIGGCWFLLVASTSIKICRTSGADVFAYSMLRGHAIQMCSGAVKFGDVRNAETLVNFNRYANGGGARYGTLTVTTADDVVSGVLALPVETHWYARSLGERILFLDFHKERYRTHFLAPDGTIYCNAASGYTVDNPPDDYDFTHVAYAANWEVCSQNTGCGE